MLVGSGPLLLSATAWEKTGGVQNKLTTLHPYDLFHSWWYKLKKSFWLVAALCRLRLIRSCSGDMRRVQRFLFISCVKQQTSRYCNICVLILHTHVSRSLWIHNIVPVVVCFNPIVITYHRSNCFCFNITYVRASDTVDSLNTFYHRYKTRRI